MKRLIVLGVLSAIFASVLMQMSGCATLGGKVHNGMFRVDDVGGAIKGNHLDFFVVGDFRISIRKISANKDF